MKSRRIISGIFLLLGVLCVAAALFLYCYNEQESEQSDQEKTKVLTQLQEILQEESEPDSSEEAASSGAAVIPKTEMTEVVIDGYAYIGYLQFPSLDAEYPVHSGWDEKRLKTAPCRYYGSIYTNDLVIAGHNYRKGFGKLKQLKVSDTVIFTDMEGVQHCYTVDAIEVLQPADIDAMIDNPWDMSLYTCTYDGKQRLTVRLKKVGTIP